MRRRGPSPPGRNFSVNELLTLFAIVQLDCHDEALGSNSDPLPILSLCNHFCCLMRIVTDKHNPQGGTTRVISFRFKCDDGCMLAEMTTNVGVWCQRREAADEDRSGRSGSDRVVVVLPFQCIKQLSPFLHASSCEVFPSLFCDEARISNLELSLARFDTAIVSEDDFLSARAFRVEIWIVDCKPIAFSWLLRRRWPCGNFKL